MNILNDLPRYWILKATSIVLKAASVLMLIVYTGQLFMWVVFGVNVFGAINGLLIDFIIRSAVLVVGAAAGGQLIDLFLSMEESLGTLVKRTRPASLINKNNDPS